MPSSAEVYDALILEAVNRAPTGLTTQGCIGSARTTAPTASTVTACDASVIVPAGHNSWHQIAVPDSCPTDFPLYFRVP